MKMNKTVGRVATTLVATAMLASLAAVPAFAENVGNSGDVTTNLFTAKLNMAGAEGAGVPSVTFQYVITDGVGTTVGTGDNTLTIRGGDLTAENLTTSVTFSNTDPGTAYDSDKDGENDSYQKAVSVNFPANTFKEPGVYRFNLTQSAITYAGVTADEVTEYYLDVYVSYQTTGEGVVQHNEPLVISNTMLVSKDATPTYDGSEVDYGDLGSDKYADIENVFETYSVTITKKVEGNMGDKNKGFTFDIDVNDPNENAVLYSLTASNSATPITFVSGVASVSATLKDGESVTISGIPVNTELGVEETNASDYDIAYSAADGSSSKVTVEADSENVAAATVTVNADAGEVVVTNTLNSVTPTGIVMDVAPYALLVVIAAAGCFVFLRKRRED